MTAHFGTEGSTGALEPRVYGGDGSSRARRPARGIPLGLILFLIVFVQAVAVALFVLLVF